MLKTDKYQLSEFEGKILLAIAKSDNLHPSIYGRTLKGETMHFWTIDARVATKEVSKLLRKLKADDITLSKLFKYEADLYKKFPNRAECKYANKIAYNQNDINQIVRQAIKNAFKEILSDD